MQNKLFLILIMFNNFNLFGQQTGTFTDSRDGKVYKTVNIGNQTWFAENLSYKDSNGCWPYDLDNSNVPKYGYLYNWETAKKGCPEGWHLPSDDEWTTLTDFLGGLNVAGGKLKSQTDWPALEIKNTTNEIVFNALSGSALGYNNGTSNFGALGEDAFFWTSTAAEEKYVWIRHLNESSRVYRDYDFPPAGYSVRCIKN